MDAGESNCLCLLRKQLPELDFLWGEADEVPTARSPPQRFGTEETEPQARPRGHDARRVSLPPPHRFVNRHFRRRPAQPKVLAASKAWDRDRLVRHRTRHRDVVLALRMYLHVV